MVAFRGQTGSPTPLWDVRVVSARPVGSPLSGAGSRAAIIRAITSVTEVYEQTV
jgi:hypothetical protein